MQISTALRSLIRRSSPRHVATTVLLTIAIAAAMISADRAQRGTPPGGLPNFDVRLSKDAASAGYVQRASASAAAAGVTGAVTMASAARAAGVAALRADFIGLEINDSPELGTPEVVGVTPGTGFMTRGNANRVTAMRQFLSQYSAAYGMTPDQVSNLVVVADYQNPAGNMAWVEMEQRINGLPVFRGTVRGGFTARGELARLTGPLAAGLDGTQLPIVPALSGAGAVSAAAANVGWNVPPASLTAKPVDATGHLTFDRATMADDATAWLTYFPLAPGIARLAWETQILGDPDGYLVLVDAEDGTVLFRKNLTNYQTQTSTYVVYKDDSPAPLSPSTVLPGTGTQAPYISRTSVTLIGNEGVNSFNNLGWMTDNINKTDGNNVEAGPDRVAPNGVDSPVNGFESRTFDFPYDPSSQDPTQVPYQNGEVIDMFYWTNVYHDRLYLLGFTEAARNFQNANFGRGGAENDRISAESQDSSGTNNANFSTQVDGNRGRMQMYLFTGPTPDRTSGIDHDVLLHELTHGTSNRLHSNAAGLNTLMAAGMGEGWSDFYARALLSTADEDPNGIYAAGGWVTNQITAGFTDNYYYGIRRFPYAVKTNVGANGKPHNPLTFADIDNTQINVSDGAFPRGPIGSSNAFEVHNIGEVWCMMLLEVRARFITRLGFDPGNQRFLQFVTDAMKLDPVNPTMVQARDSIIAAANAGGGTAADRADIWAGFATRGLGVSAQVVNAGTGSVIEAFDRPGINVSTSSLTSESIPNTRLDPGEVVTMSLCLTNNGEATSGSVTGTLLATGGVTSPSGAQVYGAIGLGTSVCQSFTFTVGTTDCGGTLTATLQADETGGSTLNAVYRFTTGSTAATSSESFDGVSAPSLPAGWTTATLGGTSNLWTTSAVSPDTAPNRAGAGDPATISDSALVSPTIFVPGGLTRLSFRNSYNVETSGDGGVLEIAIAGGAFQDIIAAGGTAVSGGYSGSIALGIGNPLGGRAVWTGNSGGYVTTAITMPAAAAGRNVVLRWRMATDASVGGTGWFIDTFSLAAYQCSNLAPAIQRHPETQAVPAGQSATLTVAVTGTETLTYQWYQGTSPSTASPVAGATSPSYTTPPVVALVSYWVSVGNGLGTANSDTAVLTPATQQAAHAVYNATLKAPTCAFVGTSCDSDTLLDGRATVLFGIEPNQPNTINNSCADGPFGVYHADESNDRIVVTSVDGTPFAAGKTVRVDATAFVWFAPANRMDLFVAQDAANPVWTLIASQAAAVSGVSQTFSATYVLPAGPLQAVRAVFSENLGAPAACGSNSGYDDHDDLVFAVTPAANSDFVRNGSFSTGTTNWLQWEAPDIVSSVVNGVFQFFKASPTSTASGQAAVFQETGMGLPAFSPLTATFDIGNSSAGRKRISVLVIDSDFSDINVCTFWLPAGAPLRTYQMKTHSTKPWGNAAIYFYAATGGSNGGNYLVDNVTLMYDPAGSTLQTTCVDPTVPSAPGGAAGPDLLTNGDFSTGLAPWGTFFDITSQVSGGVFEFLRPGTPGVLAGGVMQSTGLAMTANQILTATFKMGNSSAVRKRVTVLLHDLDMNTDLTACTFWLIPHQPLSTYTMRGFASTAWTNATVSFYAATIGPEQWSRLDDVTFARTPGSTATGTECIEPSVLGALVENPPPGGGDPPKPGGGGGGTRLPPTPTGGGGESDDGGRTIDPPFTPVGSGWQADVWSTGRRVLRWTDPIDLTNATQAMLHFDSMLTPGPSSGAVQVSADGVHWETAAFVAPGTGWNTAVVDLNGWTGRVLYVQFVFDGVAPALGDGPAKWRIDNVGVDIQEQPTGIDGPMRLLRGGKGGG